MPQQRRRRNNVIEDGSEAEADPDAEAASDAAPMTEPAPASQESGVANAGGEEQESGVADAGGEEQEAEQAAADEADTGLDPTAAEQEDEGEDDADDATLSCDTDEGIRECLAEWHQSDGFLMSADPMKDIKISHLVWIPRRRQGGICEPVQEQHQEGLGTASQYGHPPAIPAGARPCR
jgi:hypothetical protein